MRKRFTVVSLVLFAVSGVFLLSNCKKETEERTLRSEEFYRYKAGNLREYDLDSIAYNQSTGVVKTYRFLIKEIVTDSFTDLSGKPAVRIEQQISRDSGKNYSFYALHSMTKDNFGMQRVQNNQRYLKIAIPIVEKKKWNGNLYNNLGEQEFEYISVFRPFQGKYSLYTDCISVMELNDSSFINEDQKFAVYASDTGLVYYREKHLKFDQVGRVGGYALEWHLRKYWVK
jgi:hypothetical protein